MFRRASLSLLLLAVPAAAPAAAQGADLCANAQPISGVGSFAFDNSAATTDGVPNALCLAFGQDDITSDVWFSWQAPNDGVFILDTCGQTSVDTKVGVLAGSCAGAVIACNDDSCGLQSSVTFTANSGATYLLRIGTFPGAAGGTGTFQIQEDLPLLNPANGHYYRRVPAVGITWQDAKLAAELTSFQGRQGHLATLTDQQENDFVYALGDVNNYWVGGYQDTNDPSYSEPAGGWKWITGEPWSYTNWLAGEPNNAGAFGAEDFLELLQSFSFGSTWNDVHPSEHPRGYVIEYGGGPGAGFCFGDGTGGLCPCGNQGGAGEGCANSTGAGAGLATSGSASVVADDLVFQGQNLVPGQPVLLFRGLNAVNGGNGIPFGDGLRCAGGQVTRLGVRVANGSGGATWGPGLATQGGFTSGSVLRFQGWYRDPGVGSPCGAGFNLTHGFEVSFNP